MGPDDAVPLDDELAALVLRLSKHLLSQTRVNRAIEVTAALALETVGGAAGAGVSLISADGQAHSQAATSDRVLEADEIQYELGEGPCLSAWVGRCTVTVDDVTTDPRWPRWSAEVAALSLRSSLSVPLTVGETRLGAVKVYGEHPAAFDRRSRGILEGYAVSASLLLANVDCLDNVSRLSSRLRQAMAARNTVQVAKGHLMGRDQMTEDAALQYLIAESHRTGRPLTVVAAEILEQ